MKRCVAGIRSLDNPTSKDSGISVPTVWFSSMASLAAVLSDDNRALLRLIHERQPKSLTELAKLTGRKVPNLSRTLKTMAGYGLVTLTRNVREIEPTVLATQFLIVLE